MVTVDDYPRTTTPSDWAAIHEFLGLTVGAILPEMRPDQRRVAYGADITYATNNELGFDYLRENMATSLDDCGQRPPLLRHRRRGRLDPDRRGPHPADHLGPDPGRGRVVRRVRQGRPQLEKDGDYEADEKKDIISILEPGITKVQDDLGIENLYESAKTPPICFLKNSIKARSCSATTRSTSPRRRGPHRRRAHRPHPVRPPLQRRPGSGDRGQGGRDRREEYQTLAIITLQNHFRLYDSSSA